MSRTCGFILCVICLFAAGTPASAEEYTFDYQKIIDLDQPGQLDLRLVHGSVRIVGGEGSQVVIEAVKRVRASNYDEAQEVADHMEIKTRQKGTLIEIQTNYLTMVRRGRSFWQKLFGSGSDAPGNVEYTITVPYQTDIRIASVAGKISVSSLEGALTVENESGEVRAEYVIGPLSVSQPHGSIDLQWIEGDIRVKAVTGTVSVNQVRGALDIAARTGEVHVRTELDSPDDFFVETTSGQIHFAVPLSASGKLSVETASGGIQSDVPVVIEAVTKRQLVGIFGQGGPRVHLTSSSGDVTIAQF